MKICYIADINSIHTQRIVKHFAQEGHQVDVLSLNQPNSIVSKNGVKFKTHLVGPFMSPPKLSIRFILNQIKIIKRVIVILKKLKPDILHAHFITDHGFYGALSGFHPLVVFAMGSDLFVNPAKNFLYKLLYKYVLKRADVIHCESICVKEILCGDGAHPNKVKVFPIGVDLSLIRPDPPDPQFLKLLGLDLDDKIVISTRSLELIYSLDTLINAIPYVIATFPKARFVIIGNGSLENDLRALAKKLKIIKYVRFAGFIPNLEIPRFINMADIYVSTSLSDTFSIATLEAMACSKPVVVTDIPGTEEWIKHGWNGFLFPRRDYHMLAKRIKYLFENPELAKDMGKKNRQIAESRADVSYSMKEISNIYLQVVGNSSIGSGFE